MCYCSESIIKRHVASDRMTCSLLTRQHDLRTAHRCNSDSSNVLINLLNHLGRYAEAKCVAVNPRRPYQLAVGANDFYVRLYDTRMVKLAKIQVSLILSCQYTVYSWFICL